MKAEARQSAQLAQPADGQPLPPGVRCGKDTGSNNPRKATWKLEMRTGLGAWGPELLAGTTRGPGRGVTEQGEAHGSATCGQWNSKGLDT